MGRSNSSGVNTHTDQDGNLISIDEHGTQIPLGQAEPEQVDAADQDTAVRTPDVVVDDPEDPDADVDVDGDGQITGYEAMPKDELTELCRQRGLAVSGTKVELVRRLMDSDSQV